MAKVISGSVMVTTLIVIEREKAKDIQDSNHTLHQTLVRKWEGIRLPAKEPKDHVDVLLAEGSSK
jgi:hypothetical protein